MSIRLPLKTVLDVNNSAINATGPASTVGGVAHPFVLPQDTDNVVVKFTASVLGGGASAVLQTTDDGGSTWYDVARTSIVSNAITGPTAEWLSVPVNGFGFGSDVQVQTSALGSTNTGVALNTIGSAGASTLGAKKNSGLPILSQQGRVFLRYTSAVTSILNERVTVSANSQSATA